MLKVPAQEFSAEKYPLSVSSKSAEPFFEDTLLTNLIWVMPAEEVCMNRKFWNACLGNLFEHYDAALFSFLSPFLAPLIFPSQDPLSALILTYAMIPLGMLARPFGSLVFGYIGDRYGRGNALFITLAGMGAVSFGIAFSPTYLQAGMAAPLIFCAGRILQNFFSAGETMGGAIFLLENSPEKKHDLLSGLYGSSTIGGILLASAGVSLITYWGEVASGWRILYLLGCVTAIFGCIARGQSSVQQVESAQRKRFFPSVIELIMVFNRHRKCLFFIIVAAGFGYANYIFALVLLNGFIPLVSDLTKAQMLHLNSLLLILDFCALPVFGYLSMKISREKVMLGASLCILLGAVPAFFVLKNATLFSVILVRIAFVLAGVAFVAPFHSWAQQLVPPKHRYAIISFGYAVGSQILGGPTAALSLWCYKQTGRVESVALYWMLLAVLGCVVMAMSHKSKMVSTEDLADQR